MKLSFEHISKLYGDTAALQQIDLTLGAGNLSAFSAFCPPDRPYAEDRLSAAWPQILTSPLIWRYRAETAPL